MDALTSEYLPIANSANLPEKAYYADGKKQQESTQETEDDAVKLSISAEAQALVTQTQGEFLPAPETEEDQETTEEEALAEIAAENSKASESASKIAGTYGLTDSASSNTFNIFA